jgi:hypothetical protein
MMGNSTKHDAKVNNGITGKYYDSEWQKINA